ncbi:MAG: SLC13 family permease [Alphaproteobacteria bacterium]
MTGDQIMLFALLAGILGMLLWGKLRHDLVAMGGLLIAVVLGLVPAEAAFEGFAHHAVVIVALVLVASRAFENAGALSLVTSAFAKADRPTMQHIAIFGGIGAAMSAVINNVAALALLMPLDVQAARKAGRPPSITLMPLAFATILGGMVTLIGTPPNIIAATIRADQLGAPYQMFDFAPVGLAVAVAGMAFVALIGWRLVPTREDKAAGLISGASFKAELLVPEEAEVIGQFMRTLEPKAEQADVLINGLVRDGAPYYSRAWAMPLKAADLLVVEGSTEAIAAFVKSAGLQDAPGTDDGPLSSDDEAMAAAAASTGVVEAVDAEPEAIDTERDPKAEIIEAVVRADSRLVGRAVRAIDLRRQFGITLLGIARAGVVARERVRDRVIHAGDELLLTGRTARSPETLDLLGLIEIGRASVAPVRPWKVALAVGLFAAAIIVASLGWLSFTIALAIAVAVYAGTGLVPAREFYRQIEWPVIVMLACLLPIGSAFEEVGGTALIASTIAEATADYAAVVALVALMVVTMTLSDVLNNVATMVITGPIAIDLAYRLDANPDTFLMGVAVSCSCAFLTPIGHKNNTLIMGPGGFRFADYWRMGLPLEVVVLVVAIPMLLLVWPL